MCVRVCVCALKHLARRRILPAHSAGAFCRRILPAHSAGQWRTGSLLADVAEVLFAPTGGLLKHLVHTLNVKRVPRDLPESLVEWMKCAEEAFEADSKELPCHHRVAGGRGWAAAAPCPHPVIRPTPDEPGGDPRKVRIRNSGIF